MSNNHFHPEHNIHGHINLETANSDLQTLIESNDTDITNLFSQTSGVGTSGLKVLITDNTTNTTANATAINANDTDITNLFSQTSGVGTSGLKSLIQSNDTDIGIINNMIETDGNNNTVLKTGAGNKIQFSIGGQVFFNSNEIKNLTDNVLISSNVNINTLDTELTGIKNNSLSSTLKTAVDANTSKIGITSSQASAITANTAKTGITSTQATDIVNNKTELNNIIIGADVMNYSTGRIGMVSGTTGFSIMNSSLNSGVLSDEHAGLKQSNQGKTIINGTPNDPISFRKNNVEEYSSNDLKNLVDNISISQAVNLDTMESNISTNNAKTGITSTEQYTLSFLARYSSNSKVNVASGTGFSVYLNEIECRGASSVSPANANIYMTTKQGSLPGYSNNYYPTLKTDFSALYFSAGGIYAGYISGSSSVGRIDFTGQHRAVPVDNNLITNLNDHVGKIVISSGEICSLIKDASNIFHPTTGKNGISINESIPKVQLSNTYKDKRVFGIISNGKDVEENGEKHYKFGSFTSVIHSEIDDNRLTINSVGEGAILVCNLEGNIENGDLITTSTVEGIACRQEDDLIHNYTVAKATINCDFDLNSNNYNCYLDENGNKIALISCIYLL